MAEQVSVLYLYPEFVGGTLIIQVLIVQISHLPPQHDIVMSNDHEPYQTERNVTGCHQDILLHAKTVKIQLQWILTQTTQCLLLHDFIFMVDKVHQYFKDPLPNSLLEKQNHLLVNSQVHENM